MVKIKKKRIGERNFESIPFPCDYILNFTTTAYNLISFIFPS